MSEAMGVCFCGCQLHNNQRCTTAPEFATQAILLGVIMNCRRSGVDGRIRALECVMVYSYEC